MTTSEVTKPLPDAMMDQTMAHIRDLKAQRTVLLGHLGRVNKRLQELDAIRKNVKKLQKETK